jgi:hypothetical protein
MYLVPISLLLIGQQGLPLLFIFWRIVQILRQRRRKTTNTAPTTLIAIQATMNNYTPLVIRRNDDNKQLTLLSQRKLALTGKNM